MYLPVIYTLIIIGTALLTATVIMKNGKRVHQIVRLNYHMQQQLVLLRKTCHRYGIYNGCKGGTICVECLVSYKHKVR